MLKRHAVILLAVLLGGIIGLAPSGSANAAPSPYNTPGYHYSGERWWKTECSLYSSSIVRCRTEIWATQVILHNGTYRTHNGWAFNSLTYLPSSRSWWSANPLGQNKQWTGSDGRAWRTECDTATTGRNNCRTYVQATQVARVATSNGYAFKQVKNWALNNIVQFATSSIPAVTKVPAAVPKPAGVPVEGPIETTGEKAVKIAVAEVGSRYVYGTAGPSTFDCSGLTSYAYRQLGITLPRSSGSQITAGTRVSKSALKPGDLVFYYSPISHVGMYIGNGKIVDAANPRSGVRITTLDSMPYSGAVRVTDA